MKTLTVFTPTYNRAHLLPRLYDSLCKQTSGDFCWLVIDDGSTDETCELVQKWKSEDKIQIEYHYKENGGMHTGHNLAYENIETPWNTCIDSDDMLAENAVASICKAISTVDNDRAYYAVVGLDADFEGRVIGTEFPQGLEKVKFSELYLKYGVRGDKKIVYRTHTMKQLPPYPQYSGERLVPLDYKSLLADQFAFVRPFNQIWCIVEYQDDGSTRNILRQYRRNPRGFAFSRVSRIQYGLTFREQFKNAVHLVSATLFCGDSSFIKAAKRPMLIAAAVPLGILLNLYIRLKTNLK